MTALGTAAVTLVPAYASAASRATLQATAPYDAPRDAARAAARASKLQRLDQKPLLAGTKGRTFGAPVALGVHAAAPYVEPWLAARATRELEHQHKHLRSAPNAAPFVAASSRASRLFEESERRGAARALSLVGAGGGVAPGATLGAATGPVASVRVGDALLRAPGVARNPLAAGSAIAAARAAALRAAAPPPPPPAPPAPDAFAFLAEPDLFLPAAREAPPRKRPLMKPVPGRLQVELPSATAQADALRETFGHAPDARKRQS